MSRGSMVKAAAIALALVVVVNAAHAIAYSVYAGPGLGWLGQYYWNNASSAVVKVRVQNKVATAQHVAVQVQARAEDGTTVGGSTNFQLLGSTNREVSIYLSKRITGLQLTQIRKLGTPLP